MRISCIKSRPRGRKMAKLARTGDGLIDRIWSRWYSDGRKRIYCQKSTDYLEPCPAERQLSGPPQIKRFCVFPSRLSCRMFSKRKHRPRAIPGRLSSRLPREPIGHHPNLGGSSLPSSTYSRTHPLTRPVRRRIEIRLGIVIRPNAMSPNAQTNSRE